MQVHTKQLSDTSVELGIVADTAELDEIKTETLKHMRQHVKVAGFREGQTPLAMVERNADQNTLQAEFLDNAVNRLYVDAATEAKLRPVGQPQISIKKFVPFTALELTATVEVIGQITLPDYKKFRLAKPVAKVVAADVNEVLENLRNRTADKQAVSRAAKDGDEVTIDFAGTDLKTKEPVNGATGNDYPLQLGGNTFIPGFEENLIGLKTGDEKTFTVTFPKDYGVAALQNREVSFAVTVKEVKELALPKLDDAFAATVGPFKTLAELKADIKKQLEQEKLQQAERDYNNDLITKLAAKTTVALPEGVINEELDSMDRDERQNLMYRGQTWEEHLKQEGITEEQHRERNKPLAEDRVKAGLMLAEIAEAEGLSVTNDEIDVRLQLLKGQYSDPEMQSELDKQENRRSIASRLLTEKTIIRLTEYATK